MISSRLGVPAIGGHLLVGDVHASLVGVHAGNGDIPLDHVDAVDIGAHAGHRLAEDATATTDVQHAHASQRQRLAGVEAETPANLVADKRYTHGIEAVQRPKWASLVPPQVGEARVVLDLPRIDAAGVDRPGGRHGQACFGA